MGIFHHIPPPVFVGGAQPYAPRRLPPSETAVPVNDPPIRALSVLMATLAAWHAAPVTAQPLRHVPQAPIEQPAFSRMWLSSVMEAWKAPAPQIQRSPKASQFAVPENSPIPNSLDWLPTVLQSWIPPQAHQLRNRLTPQGEAAIVQQAFSRAWLPTVLNTWIPDAQPITPRRLPISVVAVQEDAPIPRNLDWLSVVAESWQPGLLPTSKRHVPQGGVIDQPRDQRLWLSTVLRSWQQGPPPAPVVRNLPASVTAVPEDRPIARDARSWLSSVLTSWQPAQPPIIKRYVPQVSEKPVSARPWLSTILEAWQIAPQPLIARRLPVSVMAVPEDQPIPEDRLATVLDAWKPVAQSIISRDLPASLLSVPEDRPIPDDKRSWLPIILKAWEPGPPAPPIVKPRVVREEIAAALITGLQAVFSNFNISPALSSEVNAGSLLLADTKVCAILSGEVNAGGSLFGDTKICSTLSSDVNIVS